MQAGTLVVTKPKSGKHERVPLNTIAYAVLVAADQSGDRVFPRLPKGMSVTFARYVRKAGLEDVSFHCLRDTFISRLAAEANPNAVMALARHRDFKTTLRYLKLADDHLREAVESLTEGRNGKQISTRSGTEIFIDSQLID